MTVQTAASVWRNYQIPGVPASGARRPEKAEIVTWGTWLETLLSSSAAGLAYSTLSAINADLAHNASTVAVVYGDGTPANNGLYVKSGASGVGAWSRVSDLPTGLVRLTVTGGTANAIVATAPETPTVPGNKLYLLTPVASNTDITTIVVNGNAAVPIKSTLNNDLVPNSLLANSTVIMAWQTDHYQLLVSVPVDASGILTSALSARDAAAASAASAASSASALGNQVHQYDTKALAAAATVPGGVTYLHTISDGAYYKRVGAQPAHAGKLQSVDGAWWELVPVDGFVSVDSFGAVADPGDLSTDSHVAIQAAFDTATALGVNVRFSAKRYVSSTKIVLVDAHGHNFQGDVAGAGKDLTTITFTNNGSGTDIDSAMQHGFEVYPVTNGLGGDITGFRRGEISGIKFVGPAHGASIYMANSQQAGVRRCSFATVRYGIANECCIHSQIVENTFADFKNAGVGLLETGDTARVWYASGLPTTSYWNDSPRIVGNQFTSSVIGGLAHILDHGSQAECNRLIENNIFFNTVGANPYGYLARNAQPTFVSNWFEDVKYPVRMLAANALEGGAGANLTGVTAAEPAGTYAIGTFPDGFCISGTFTGNFTSRATDSFDLSGITASPCFIGQNFVTQQLGTAIVNRNESNSMVVDAGNYVPIGTYKNIAFPTHYTNIASAGLWADYAPTIAAQTGAITTATASGRYGQSGGTVNFNASLTITTNGSGAGSIRIGLPVPAKGGASLEWECRGRNSATGADLLVTISSGGNYATVLTTTQTYPGADGAVLKISGTYEMG
ncbi:hypothetical protein [Bradyrhizobium sp. BR 1433]|uniref:hypothetical protein n=1 Tax=Bradyrhizobium sp. BR 1433 TaxID=3447967 RepID=UPI003EE7BBDE